MKTRLRAAALNRDCACQAPPVDATAGFYADKPVFIGSSDVQSLHALIRSVHAVVALPAYRQAVLEEAPALARLDPGTHGVFTGFDFHVGAEGPRLIEINTNAGGAMLNAAAGWRHPACCGPHDPRVRLAPSREVLERTFLAMFREEWRLANPGRELRRVAIVDDDPERQFLFREFELFAELFRADGLDAVIADARTLEFDGSRLRAAGQPIDLVYNRLTDFGLEEPTHEALRRAYEARAAVVTPHPRAHALYADKRNLVRFSDESFLRGIGASDADIAVLLAGVPRTLRVEPDESWWRERKDWFFKPASGFGSRGAFRGDKLTRRVFAEVMQGGYVAQRLAPAGTRLQLKADLRVYTYAGEAQLMAARLYQGQTTNFRTPGGGFAPVVELLDAA